MNRYCFTVNGKDFSDVVEKYGYETNLIPVYSKTVTTLDKVDHMCLVRMRGQLTVRVNSISAERAKDLSAELSSLPASIGYHSFQIGTDVEQTMRISGLPMGITLITPTTVFLDGASITFDEL